VSTPGEFEYEQLEMYARHLVETKRPDIDHLLGVPTLRAMHEEVVRLCEGEVRDLLLLALILQQQARKSPTEFADWAAG